MQNEACTYFIATSSSCRCPRTTASRWASTCGCASGCWRAARCPRRISACRSPRATPRSTARIARAIASASRVASSTAAEIRAIGFPWSERMVERSRRSSGATLAAARAALTRGWACEPRRRHAPRLSRSRRGLLRVQRRGDRRARHAGRGAARSAIAIVDCDVHQGNGTAAIFAGDDSVFTFSIHGARNFPFAKETSDLDIELPDGTGDEEYLWHLERGAGRDPGALAPAARVLPRGRGSLRGRSARPPGAQQGGAAAARRAGAAHPARARHSRGDRHGGRLCAGHRGLGGDPCEHTARRTAPGIGNNRGPPRGEQEP